MRYTTIIDLREFSELYRNQNVRLVYLHLVLIAGYRDDNRDIVTISIRKLAADVGLTVSAVRHALALLRKWKLLKTKSSTHRVRKFVEQETITPRAKTKQQALAADERRRQTAKNIMEEADRNADKARRTQLEQAGKNYFTEYYERQLELAAQGDEDAARIVAKRRAEYEEHIAKLKEHKK